jgi:pimeloyl-ACP methyl ester carboxylesterase
MRARVDSTQSGGAKVNLVVFVLNRQHGLVDIHSLAGPPARAPQWQPYSFTNKLGAAADTLLLRLFCFMSGTFAFDDISVEVQQAGQWQPLALVNSAFQTPPTIADALPPGWRVDVPIVGFTWHWQTSAGNAYLEVRSRGIIAYGHHAPAGHYCTANGVRLYYETYGQGPPLLLLHGNGQSIQDVSNQIAAFSPTYRVIAVDTRDHGKSAATRGALTYDLLADDMSALLDSLHVPAAHIVGWSDGGNTGLSMALRHPTRVKSLVTMGANLVADTTAVEASMLRQVRQDYRLTSLLGLISRPYRQARRRTAMLLHYPNLRPAELATIHAPVLVLAGEKDIIKQAHTRLIGRSIPGAQVYLLPALTHDAPKENPQLFNETVLHFLQRLEP